LSHDEAVDLFADTPSEVLAPKLKVLLRSTDQQKIVAILADLDASKAAELIGPLATDFSWLPALPRAAEAIAQCAGELEWRHEAETGRLERAARSPEGTEGYFRQYAQGCIYWRDDTETTCAASDEMATFHLASGGTGGELGFPQESRGHWHSGRTDGWGQKFEGGYLFSSSHGTYSLSTELWNAWPRWLGFPLSDVEAHDGFRSQRFEEGVLYSSEAGMFAVRLEVAERTEGWVPISAEEDAHAHPTGRVQRFNTAGSAKAAVYSSESTGVYRVFGRLLALYEELGGPGSWLGLPTAAARSIEDGRAQRFEHGWIYDRVGDDPVVISAETVELVGNRLGWPVSEEQPIGTGDGRIQFFESGAVVLRDGKREVLVRSKESTVASGPQGRPAGDLSKMIVPDLKRIASQLGIQKVDHMRKWELIAAIESHMPEVVPPVTPRREPNG
jgi:uncharacterized protein with LGFP repeats